MERTARETIVVYNEVSDRVVDLLVPNPVEHLKSAVA
jgi:hypothetical protein